MPAILAAALLLLPAAPSAQEAHESPEPRPIETPALQASGAAAGPDAAVPPETTEPVIQPMLSTELVESKIAEAEANAALTEETKSGLIERYRAAAVHVVEGRKLAIKAEGEDRGAR